MTATTKGYTVKNLCLHLGGKSYQLARQAIVTERSMRPFRAGNRVYCDSDSLKHKTGAIRLIDVDKKVVRELFPDSQVLVADLTYSQYGYPAIISSATLTLPATIDSTSRCIGDVLINFEYLTQ